LFALVVSGFKKSNDFGLFRQMVGFKKRSLLPFIKWFSGLVAIKGQNKKAVQTAGRLTSRSS